MTSQVKDIPTKAIDGQRTGSYELKKRLVPEIPDFGSQRVLTPRHRSTVFQQEVVLISRIC